MGSNSRRRVAGMGIVLAAALAAACAEEPPSATHGDLAAASRRAPGAAWWVTSNQGGAFLGDAVASAGDVNGDGHADVLIGAPGWDVAFDEGQAALYLGSAAGLPAAPAWVAHSSQRGGSLGGALASAGDVNGDGYDDVIVGAQDYDNPEFGEGQALVYHGSPAGLSAASAWSAESDVARAAMGNAVASAGDVNGDGYDDVVVGLGNYEDGQWLEGAAAVYLGSAAGLSPTAAWFEPSDLDSAYFGASVGSGDFDADGYADVVVGAGGWNGGAFVYRGSAAGLPAVPSWSVRPGLTQVQGALGNAVATGDVNGDGYDDLVVGAPEEDGALPTVGRAHLFLGSPSGLSAAASWITEGEGRGDGYGWAVALPGDLNGDGYGDVVVGAPTASRAYVYLGSASGPCARPAWTLTADAGSLFGTSIAGAGDVDADGYADLLVGASAHREPEVSEGAAFLFTGRALADADRDGVVDLLDLCPSVPDPAQLDADRDLVGNACDRPFVRVSTPTTLSQGEPASLVAEGAAPGEVVRFAASVGGGGAGPCLPALGGLCLDLGPGALDLGSAVADAAGVATLAVTFPLVQPNGTYVVQAAIRRGAGGSASVSSDPRILDGAVLDWDGDGLADAFEGLLGTDPTHADTDGDGLEDPAELEPHVDPLDPDSDGDGVADGADLCVAGDDAADADGDLVADACDACPAAADPGQADADGDGLGDACEGPVLGSAAWVGLGLRDDRYGASVASAGDVDGDGFDDVIVGAEAYTAPQGGEGAAFLYPGTALGPSAAPAWHAESDQVWGSLGSVVAPAGDVNGDGYADVLVAAPLYDAGQLDEGRVWLYLGSSAGLSAGAAWTAESNQVDAELGTSMASAGDVNGDGFDDVILGAPLEDHGQADEGRAYLYLGSAAGLAAAPAWTAERDQVNAHFGASVASAGDVNGDGYDDVVVGADWFDDDQDDEGGVWVYLGHPGGLTAEPVWRVTGDQQNAYLGEAVAPAGDVNGDGYDDLLVGTGWYDQDPGFDGAALVYLGSPRGLSPTAWWIVGATERDSRFGSTVAPAGDVDRDGYDDVLVGAWLGDHGQRDEGRAWLYLGSATGLAPAAAWSGESDLAGATYGTSIASAGDVDGNGAPDVIVGADYAGQGGAAMVYLAP